MKNERHKQKMARKRRERENAHPTRIEQEVARLKARGHLRAALHNYSPHPKGKPRTRAPKGLNQ